MKKPIQGQIYEKTNYLPLWLEPTKLITFEQGIIQKMKASYFRFILVISEIRHYIFFKIIRQYYDLIVKGVSDLETFFSHTAKVLQ